MKNCKKTSTCAVLKVSSPRRGGIAGLTRRNQEEGVNEDVEAQGGEDVARVVVVPEAELDRDDDGGRWWLYQCGVVDRVRRSRLLKNFAF